MNKNTLFSLVKSYQEAQVDAIFTESDLICILGEQDVPYYVSLVDNAFAAYRGDKGLTGYLALSLQEDEASDLEYMELQLVQECLMGVLNYQWEDLDKEDRKVLEESGVLFADGQYPQFRSKLQYQYPWHLTDQEERDLCIILKGLLFAKTYFATYKKTGRQTSLSSWLDSLSLQDQEKKEYIPCLKMQGESFSVTAIVLQDAAYGFSYPQAFFTDEERQHFYKHLRAKVGKILYLAIGLFPTPIMPETGARPLYPVYSLVYDPQNHQIVDVQMVEDYEKDHGKFVARLLWLFEEQGKPQAIHCFGKRALPLVERLCPQIGIMVVEGGNNEEMEQVLSDMFAELGEDDGQEDE